MFWEVLKATSKLLKLHLLEDQRELLIETKAFKFTCKFTLKEHWVYIGVYTCLYLHVYTDLQLHVCRRSPTSCRAWESNMYMYIHVQRLAFNWT